MTIASIIMRLTGSDRFGDGQFMPPEPDPLRYIVHDQTIERVKAYSPNPEVRFVTSGNDGFELWMGTPHRWIHHMSAHEVALLTRWLIVHWYIRARWLGLRRPLYYWALRRSIAKAQRR